MKKLFISLVLFLFSFNISFAQELPVEKAKVDKELNLGAYWGCSLACAMGWTIKCSSCLPSQGNNKYTEVMLSDGNFNTAWCEGVEGDGIGEWIEFHLKNHPGKDVGKTSFDGINIANGYLKSKDIWKNNSRVKQFRMDINGKAICYINLSDSMFDQHVRLSDCYSVEPGDVIRLTITEVYPGNLYTDTCITEIVLMGAH
ncbi:MAG: hypothetical protein ABRQ37_15605 [Candidatus Eremiobacterota bacterium]